VATESADEADFSSTRAQGIQMNQVQSAVQIMLRVYLSASEFTELLNFQKGEYLHGNSL